ncbi:hypothetical protein SESBI_21718 [Sesbania bispinosa]|nr:hypothetical protein SESBI_21718 [Sesbania bispinosa]
MVLPLTTLVLNGRRILRRSQMMTRWMKTTPPLMMMIIDVEGTSLKVDPLCPIIKVSRVEIREACQRWKKAILVKLLGKKISMKFLRQCLLKMWQPSGSMEMIDLENDFFLISLEI